MDMNSIFTVILGLLSICLTFVLFIMKDLGTDVKTMNSSKQDKNYCENLFSSRNLEISDIKATLISQQATLTRHGESLAKIEVSLESIKHLVEQRRIDFRSDD